MQCWMLYTRSSAKSSSRSCTKTGTQKTKHTTTPMNQHANTNSNAHVRTSIITQKHQHTQMQHDSQMKGPNGRGSNSWKIISLSYGLKNGASKGSSVPRSLTHSRMKGWKVLAEGGPAPGKRLEVVTSALPRWWVALRPARALFLSLLADH